MNYSVVRYILGWIMIIEAAFMLLPCTVALIYGEKAGLSYLTVLLCSALIGCVSALFRPKKMNFYLKEGFVTVALSWILLSIIGAIPFVMTGEIPSFVDALFETISGFTTTGASILSDVEALSKASIFWRSFTHWIGGMGVLVFLLAIVPMTGGSNMNLMKAESPGPVVGKLVPKVRSTASILYLIYIGMTIIQMIFLMAGGMPLFDSVTISLGTAGTGGFNINNVGMAGESAYSQWVVAIFMILFAVNFNAYFFIVIGRIRDALKLEEVKIYFAIVAVASAIIFIDVRDLFVTGEEALRHTVFQVGTIMSTTGYATTDFNLWPTTSKIVLIMLMFVGGCAGSTAGGMKVSRFIIAIKTFFKEIISYLHPRSVKKLKMDGKMVEHETLRSVNVYFITFIVLFSTSLLLVSLEGRDLVTSFTAVSATINNVGPGLYDVGPMSNFGSLTDLTKGVLMFDMLVGRLEIFPIMLLFCPSVWKRKRSAI